MKTPTVRFVFDRKKVAGRQRKGLVQIEVCSERKRKWIGTGVKVYADQWDDRYKVVRSTDMMQLNERLDMQIHGIQDFINSLLRSGETFDFAKLERYISDSSRSDSFVDFMRMRIEDRNDITETTRKNHRVTVRTLDDFGLIRNMDDLTRRNVELFDGYLRNKGYMQTTIANYHKNLKTYIREAMKSGYIDESPYFGFKIDKGKSSKRKYLTDDELRRMSACVINSPMIERVRDLFMFQCYTGLAYADLAKFDFTKDVENRNGKFVIADRRQKTDEDYFIVLLPQAVGILGKYGYRLPQITNQKYNAYLKVAAQYAGIDKPLTTHCARHTFAVFALNHGVPIEVVAKMLGHANIRTTQIYARILNKSVEKGFDVIERALGDDFIL